MRLTEYVGMPHGYLSFPHVCRSAPQALAELCTELRTALTRESVGWGRGQSLDPLTRWGSPRQDEPDPDRTEGESADVNP